MKVNEKFSEIGLFTAIHNCGGIDYMDLIPYTTMDFFYMANHGNRNLSSWGNTKTIEEIAETFYNVFAPKWNKLYEMAIDNIDIDYNYIETQSENVGREGQKSTTISSVNTSSVNAYNDDDFVGDEKEENQLSNSHENTNTKQREYIKRVLNGSKTDYHERILNYLQNDYFNDIIVRDINRYLTLSIFD